MAYKHVIRAKTKNLFDISKVTNYPPTYNVDNSYLKTKPLSVSSIIFLKETLIQLCPNLVSGNTYVFNAKTTGKYQQILLNDIVWEFGTARTLTDADLNKTIGLYAEPTNTADEWTIISEVQIEEGSTPTPYTPYNYLQSNKRMIKVSDVCQVFNKEEFIATTTKGGITFTNNGDGSFTINGTATANVFMALFKSGVEITGFNINHKYLICGNLSNTIQIFETLSGNGGARHYNDSIFTCVNSKGYLDLRIIVGTTATNYIFRPQLFDLTEMFGAGHEPATVAEFRQRFPNELYPYSPQCWLTSYKSAVVCKTKNLFDVNNAVVINYNSQQETTDATHYVKDGIVYSDWNSYHIGTCVGIKGGWTLPAGTYTVSAKIAYNTKMDDEDRYRGVDIGFVCVLADGSITRYMDWVSYGIPGNRIAYTAQIPAGCKNIMPYLSVYAGELSSSPAAYCELMVEQGSTATSYVPYQHL